MPMREECKHFQSRTYDSGEVARFCILDLAPEAPWKCPDDCPSYAPRLADVGWAHGSLVEPAIESMPDVPGEEAAQLLGQAEEIINALTKIQALRVAPRSSAFAFKGQNQDIRKVGEQLGVAGPTTPLVPNTSQRPELAAAQRPPCTSRTT